MTSDVIMDSSAVVETVGHVHLRVANTIAEGGVQGACVVRVVAVVMSALDWFYVLKLLLI